MHVDYFWWLDPISELNSIPAKKDTKTSGYIILYNRSHVGFLNVVSNVSIIESRYNDIEYDTT